jgi:hypothetical protein
LHKNPTWLHRNQALRMPFCGGWPGLRVHLALMGAPSKLRLGGSFDFFHHTQPVSPITDIQPNRCDNVY